MRNAIIVLGLLLIGLGVAIWFGKLSYPDEKSTIRIGRMSATLTQRRPVPPWLGGVTALTGLAIVVLGTRYRR